MMQKKIRMYGMLSAFLYCGMASAQQQQQQHTVEMIPFGNMDQWVDRQIKESIYFMLHINLISFLY